MGVSNVNNLKNIDLSKLSLLQKSKGAQSSKPEYMKMTGSIFNAPQVKQQQEAIASQVIAQGQEQKTNADQIYEQSLDKIAKEAELKRPSKRFLYLRK